MTDTTPTLDMTNKRISVAPMMDWTTREYRYFARLFNPHAWLYTEMISTGAILHGDKARFLDFHETEHPLALQLGGADPTELTQCTELAQQWGYDEVNLNVGCPSDRVQHNKIGAILMAEPDTVATCVKTMQAEVDITVTVKHRIGIDDFDSYEHMLNFVDTVVEKSECTFFTVHARIALLNGLSPKENREVPPLRYDDVYRLKAERPHLTIEINGGIKTLDEVTVHLEHVDGVMIGRAAYHDPYILAECMKLWGETPPDRFEILDNLYPYLEQCEQNDIPLHIICRHYLGLFQGLPGARKWRQALSGKKSLSIAEIKAAAEKVQVALDYAKAREEQLNAMD